MNIEYRPMAELKITVSITKSRWDKLGDDELDIEGECIQGALDKVAAFAHELLGFAYHLDIET